MSSYNVIKKTETRTAVINLCDDDIMRVMLRKKSEIDLEKAQENIDAYINLIEDKKYAFLFYAEDDSVIYTEEARRNAKVNEASFAKLCVAVIVKNLAHRLVANFYYKFYKPGYPFKVFSDIQSAEVWCLTHTNKTERAVA